MALNLGLILGSALAGAAAGGGGAVEEMGQQYQKQQGQEDLVRLQNQLDEAKQMRIQEAGQNFAREQQGALFQHQDTTQAKTQDFEHTEKGLDRTLQSSLEDKRASTSVQVANIGAGATLGAARERIAAEKDILNKPQVIQTENGPMMLNPQSGTAAPVTGPNGKPVGGMQMTQIDRVLLDSANKVKIDPLSTDEQKAAAQAQIMGIANKYNPSSAAGGQSAAPALTPDKQAKMLAKLKADPSATNQQWYDHYVGAGAAATALKDAAGTGTGGAGIVNNVTTPTTPAASPSGYPAAAPAAGPTPAAVQAASTTQPAPAPYQPSGIIANALTPQTGAPPTQPAFKQPVDAFGRPIPQNTVQNPIGLGQ